MFEPQTYAFETDGRIEKREFLNQPVSRLNDGIRQAGPDQEVRGGFNEIAPVAGFRSRSMHEGVGEHLEFTSKPRIVKTRFYVMTAAEMQGLLSGIRCRFRLHRSGHYRAPETSRTVPLT